MIHGLLDRVMTCANVAPTESYASDSLREEERRGVIAGAGGKLQYYIKPVDRPTFWKGRCAAVMLVRPGEPELELGAFGIVHPEVLAAYELEFPTSALEMDLEPLM